MSEDEDVELELPVEPNEAEEELPLEEQPFTYSDDEDNLVRTFEAHPKGLKALKRIADKVIKDFEEAKDATAEYREKMAEDWKLFAGELPSKPYPFEGCANLHVPIMLENLTRLTSRVAAELFGDWSNVFGVIPVGPDDDEVADILTLHGNWQIREQIDDFPRQQDRGLLSFFMWGDVTCHSFFDEVKRTNRHEVLTPDEFYVPYVFTTTAPDYSDVPYRVKVLHRYRHDLQRMRERWTNVDKVLKRKSPSWNDEPDAPLAESAAESTFVEPPTTGGAPYKLLQYEGWMEMPDRDDDRFIQVIIDHTTKTILRLALHEELDWRDKQRFDLQNEEYNGYLQAMGAYNAQYDAAIAQEDQVREGLGMSLDVPGPMKAPLIAEAGAPAQMMAPPVRPSWMAEGVDGPPLPVKRVPIHMFSHGVCIESMVGSLGLSFGRIQADFNRAANISFNQFSDSATLSNIKVFIAADGVKLANGKDGISMTPGSVNTLTGTTGADIRNSFTELATEPANPQLFQIVDKLYAYGQSSIQSPGILSGEPGKSGETFRGVSTRLDQAVKQLSVSGRKYAMFLTQILKNNARLNAMFLDDEEMLRVVDHRTNMLRTITVGRHLYERSYRVQITSDLKFSSEAQRIAEADELVQLPQAVPPLQANLAFQYEAVKKALVARGRHDMVQVLGAPPPPSPMFGMPPPPPPGMMPPGAPPGPPGGPPPEAA